MAAGGKRRPALWIGLAGAMLVFLAARFLSPGILLGLFPEQGLTGAQAVTVVLGGPVVLWLIILAHECGHVAAGLAAGFRFHLLVAGPVCLGREVSGLRVSLNRAPEMMAGLAVTVPVNDHGLARGMAWGVAGGPALSLLAGLGALSLSFLLPANTGSEAVLRALLGLFAIGSLIVGLATLAPTSVGGVPSDGARLRLLLQTGPESRRDLALLTLSARSMMGQRPRDWSRGLLAEAASVEDLSRYRILALLFAFWSHWDAGRLEDATRSMAAALRVAPRLSPQVMRKMALEAAFFLVLALRDRGTARAWAEVAGAKPETVESLRYRAASTANGETVALAIEETEASLEKGLSAFYREELTRLLSTR